MMKHRPKPVFLFCAITFIGCGRAPGEDEEPIASTESESLLGSSQFEIDSSANLKLDGEGSLDWATVTEARKIDLATGQSDDSYGGGAKEDDPCPAVGTGSIPNNKSDLRYFGVYVERTTLNPVGYLHLFWSRVQDPTGTTLMDFEFNKLATKCSNGVNPVRTAGDFLLEYRIEQGGTVVTLKLRTWTEAGVWGTAANLGTAAVGSINTSQILDADSDGLGTLSARTFGEASIDLKAIFPQDKCESFGSAFVKSRSSDSFTSALKDFIAPTPVNITNCGQVIIRKQTDPDGLPNPFTFTHNLKTDPQIGSTFTLTDGQSNTITSVLRGTGYTVTESPAGSIQLASIDCSASSGVTPVVDLANRKITFDIDNPLDVVDCTFNNRARGAIRITKTRKHKADGPGSHPHAGVEFTISNGPPGSSTSTVTTDSSGNACVDNLILGSYTVTETVPTGYAAQDTPSKTVAVTTSGSCSLPELPPTPVSFVNLPLTNISIAVTSIVPGGTASTISCQPILTSSGGDGTTTLTGVVVPGTYTCTIVVDP